MATSVPVRERSIPEALRFSRLFPKETRPTCPCCGKRLVPATFAVAGHIDYVHLGKPVQVYGTPHQVLAVVGVDREPFRPPLDKLGDGGPHAISVFYGEWRGYGPSGHEFCSLNCCRQFAVAAHRAGYRITRGGGK
jgi:hypothetical protein